MAGLNRVLDRDWRFTGNRLPRKSGKIVLLDPSSPGRSPCLDLSVQFIQIEDIDNVESLIL